MTLPPNPPATVRPDIRPGDLRPCKIYLPPYASASGLGTVEKSGQGSLEATDNLNRSFATPAQGLLGVDTDLHHTSRSHVGRNDWGLHKVDLYLAVPVAGRYLGYRPDWRLKLTATLVVERCVHRLTRSPIFPPPHSSHLHWMTEVHLMPADRGEVLKFQLFNRRLDGATSYSRTLSPVEPGTEKVFSASTGRRYRVSEATRWMVGLWSEHKAEANNVFFDSIGELTLRLKSLEICAVP